jgi:opacity protein-like surface antigen
LLRCIRRASVHTQVNAQASAAKEVIGPYVGAAFGTAFGNREIDDSNRSDDERIGHGAKVYGGYQLTEHGKVTDTGPSTAATNSLLGNKTSLLVGTGAEYVLNHNVSFSVELDSYGKISEQVKGNTLTLGTRFTF